MRGVAQRGNVQDLTRFSTFIQICTALTGQQLNYVRPAETAGISQPTAKSWLGLLEGLGIIDRLPASATNGLKRITR